MNQRITAVLVPESRRLNIAATLFGHRFPLQLEPAIYQFAGFLAEDYRGGYWHFYTLSNGGFYMAPAGEGCFAVSAENGYEGELSGDALGGHGLPLCLQPPVVPGGRLRRVMRRALSPATGVRPARASGDRGDSGGDRLTGDRRGAAAVGRGRGPGCGSGPTGGRAGPRRGDRRAGMTTPIRRPGRVPWARVFGRGGPARRSVGGGLRRARAGAGERR
jgi:hypothetical protein